MIVWGAKMQKLAKLEGLDVLNSELKLAGTFLPEMSRSFWEEEEEMEGFSIQVLQAKFQASWGVLEFKNQVIKL